MTRPHREQDERDVLKTIKTIEAQVIVLLRQVRELQHRFASLGDLRDQEDAAVVADP
jgi:hypothetical protein